MYSKDTPSGTITFSYDTTKVFNEVSLMSSFMSKSLKEASDDYTLSDDEKSVFTMALNAVLPDIYEVLLKLTSGVENAFEVTEDKITIKIQDNKAYNGNTVSLVDTSLLECIKEGCLRYWYNTCSHFDFYKICDAKYQNALLLLRNRLFQLKKKQILSNLGPTPSVQS